MCTTEGKTTNIVDSGSSGSTYYNSKYNKGIRTKTQSEVTRFMTNVRETRKTPTLTPTYTHTQGVIEGEQKTKVNRLIV